MQSESHDIEFELMYYPIQGQHVVAALQLLTHLERVTLRIFSTRTILQWTVLTRL